MSWYKNLWARFVGKFLDYWLDVIVVALATAIGFYIKDWLFVTISVWPVVIALLLVVIVILVIRVYRLSPKSFVSFPVIDNDLDTSWWILNEPKEWIDLSFNHHPNSYTDSLLDGPFCRTKRDSGDLCLGDFGRINDTSLSETCRVCRRSLFQDEDGEPKSVEISRSELKLVVIHAPQREARRGKKIKKNFSFGIMDLER